MLTMRNPELHKQSATAEHVFRRLRQANIATYVLLGMLALLAIWNVATLIVTVRGDIPDLADTGSISTHISSRLITVVSAVTLAVFIFKEWRWGERSFTAIYFLAALLFLWLVPVMSAETEPTQEAMQLEFTLSRCEPGGIEGSSVLDSSKCKVAELSEGEIFMSPSNPMNGSLDIVAPDDISPNMAQWNVEGRGRFRVYFLLRQESMEICTESRFTTSLSNKEELGYHCLEHGGEVWSVHPFDTSAVENRWITIYQEVAP